MIIALLQEVDEARVALTPAGLAKLAQNNQLTLWVERGAGQRAFFSDAEYAAHATLVDRADALRQADLLVGINPPPAEEWPAIKPGAILVAELAPFSDTGIVDRLRSRGIEALSLDMIPRTSLAQTMDVLSSMASIAGYRAVIEAARYLPRYLPMMITAAGSVRPSRVLVLGAGVAGLQAIATARRMGATVEASDTRQAAREEVESLGAKFVQVEGARDDQAAGGYAVVQTEEFLARQREEVQRRAARADIIITTAQVRGRRAPILVPTTTVEQMQPGSVIVDLAASTGGNCELTEDQHIVRHAGVTIIGHSNLAATMPQDASVLYSNNVLNFLQLLLPAGALKLDPANEIIRGAWITAPAMLQQD